MINQASELAARFWAQGRLDDCPVLDMHAHMGPFYGGLVPLDTPEAVLEAIREGKVAPAGKNTPTSIILKQMSGSARRKIKKKLFRKA